MFTIFGAQCVHIKFNLCHRQLVKISCEVFYSRVHFSLEKSVENLLESIWLIIEGQVKQVEISDENRKSNLHINQNFTIHREIHGCKDELHSYEHKSHHFNFKSVIQSLIFPYFFLSVNL